MAAQLRVSPTAAALKDAWTNGRRHGVGCPCCAPPSGAGAWGAPGARPLSGAAAPLRADGGPGAPITCKAAVAFGVNDLRVETIVVAPPKAGEVRLKVAANALCHTDIYTLEGSDPEGLFPSILGHEAGAVVESVGEGVTSVRPGDKVIPCYTPQCREPDCVFCASPKTNLCPRIRATQGQGVMPDGTTRFTLAADGTPVHHFMGCSTFAEYTVVAEISCAKVDASADLGAVCLLGCGVSTGWGAVWKTADVERGASVAVFGLGAVGLAVVQAARQRDARRIFAIDVNPDKFAAARALGATDCVDPTAHDIPIQQWLVGETTWGVDYTFDWRERARRASRALSPSLSRAPVSPAARSTGSVGVMRAALEAAHRGWGVSTVIGVAASGQEISTRPFQLVTGRVWKGTAFGGFKSRDEVPELVKRTLCGDIEIEPYITHRLEGVEKTLDAVDALHGGDCLRAVVSY